MSKSISPLALLYKHQQTRSGLRGVFFFLVCCLKKTNQGMHHKWRDEETK